MRAGRQVKRLFQNPNHLSSSSVHSQNKCKQIYIILMQSNQNKYKNIKTNYGWFRLFNFQFTLQVNDSRILPVNEQLSIIKWSLSHLILMIKCIDRAPSPNTFVHSILFRRLSHTCRFSLAVHVHNFIQNQSLAILCLGLSSSDNARKNVVTEYKWYL